MTEKRLIETKGRQLFDSFLREQGITQASAAKALGVSEVTVLHWRTGEKRPVDHQRAKIEIWTGGAISAATWRTDEERGEIDRIQPLQTTGAA
jgi:hypothetical protein